VIPISNQIGRSTEEEKAADDRKKSREGNAKDPGKSPPPPRLREW